jgi:hypothetical protein
MVKNLVYKGSDFVYYENKSNFSQRYTLTKIGQDNKIIEVASTGKLCRVSINGIIITLSMAPKYTKLS